MLPGVTLPSVPPTPNKYLPPATCSQVPPKYSEGLVLYIDKYIEPIGYILSRIIFRLRCPPPHTDVRLIEKEVAYYYFYV